ncbi:MAG: MnhB domain-containing protein [Trueperaceae bacterium]
MNAIAAVLEQLFDALLALTLVLLAARLLFNRDLFASAVLFVAFGLTTALVWVRLAAPDVALAEAAVGAGLTGALILRAAGQMSEGGRPVPPRPLPVAAVVVLAGALCLTLLHTLSALPWPRSGLAAAVSGQLGTLGLEQPVTAVLLVFRGYDTWLELAVLLATILAVLGASPAADLAARRIRTEPDLLLATLARLLLPVAVIVAGYMVWRGTGAPGGAFQGGAVLAAAVVLGYLAGLRPSKALRGWRVRLLALLGFALPLLLTLPALLGGRPLFSYPSDAPGNWIPVIEMAIAASVAFTLSALFAGAEPAAEPDDVPIEASRSAPDEEARPESPPPERGS